MSNARFMLMLIKHWEKSISKLIRIEQNYEHIRFKIRTESSHREIGRMQIKGTELTLWTYKDLYNDDIVVTKTFWSPFGSGDVGIVESIQLAEPNADFRKQIHKFIQKLNRYARLTTARPWEDE